MERRKFIKNSAFAGASAVAGAATAYHYAPKALPRSFRGQNNG